MYHTSSLRKINRRRTYILNRITFGSCSHAANAAQVVQHACCLKRAYQQYESQDTKGIGTDALPYVDTRLDERWSESCEDFLALTIPDRRSQTFSLVP